MAFKINTNAYKITAQQPIKKPQPPVSNKIENTAQEPPKKPQEIKPQVKYPNQNLLNKYTAQGAFFNAQNTLSNQFGIKSDPKNSDSSGEDLLVQFLQGQNNSLDGINEQSKMQINNKDSLELESKIKEQLKENADDDFLSTLLWRIQNNG